MVLDVTPLMVHPRKVSIILIISLCRSLTWLDIGYIQNKIGSQWEKRLQEAERNGEYILSLSY